MSLINIQKDGIDNTVKIFDNFYNITINIPLDEYNFVLAYFKEVCATEEIANNFTAFLFRIAQESGINALTILDTIQTGNDKIKLNQTMAYYINSFKSKHSLYGVAVVPVPVQPVARNVVI